MYGEPKLKPALIQKLSEIKFKKKFFLTDNKEQY